MYENAAKTPVPAIAAMDELLGQSDRRSSDAFICTPILGKIRRRMKNSIDIEIETRTVNLLRLSCVNIHRPSSSLFMSLNELIEDSSVLITQMSESNQISKSLTVHAIID